MNRKVAESEVVLFELCLEGDATCICCSPDGTVFAVGTSLGRIFLFSQSKGSWKKHRVPYVFPEPILCLRIPDGGQYCLIVSEQTWLCRLSWKERASDDACKDSVELEFRTQFIFLKSCLYASNVPAFHSFDVAQFGNIAWFGCSGNLLSVRLSPFCNSADAALSFSNVGNYICHAGIVFALDSLEDGTRVICSSSQTTNLQIVDVFSGHKYVHSSLLGHDDWISTLKLEESGNMVISGDASGQTCLWDLRLQDPLVGKWSFFRSISAVEFLRDSSEVLVGLGTHDDYILEDEEPLHRGTLLHVIDMRKAMQNVDSAWDRIVDVPHMREMLASNFASDEIICMAVDLIKSRMFYVTTDGLAKVADIGLLENRKFQFVDRVSKRELGFGCRFR